VLSNIIVMTNSGTLPFTFTTWLSVWDIVYDWLLESIIGSYSAFILTDWSTWLRSKVVSSWLVLKFVMCQF